MSKITEAQVKELLELSKRTPQCKSCMTEQGRNGILFTVFEKEPLCSERIGSFIHQDYAWFFIEARNLLPALAQSWLEMAGEVERLRKDNAEHLKIGTIAYNALFLVCESLARNTKIDDERCAQCTKFNEHYKKYPGIPSFLNCTSCQFKRWMDAGEEMNNDPELKTWAEADTPEKAIDLLFPESPKEAAHD